MKILIASDLHYPTINGVATFSRNIARGMAERGHEVMVIAPSQTGKKCKEVDGNYTIARTMSVPFPFYQNFRISLAPDREVKKILQEFDPDVIHIQMLLGIGQSTMKYGNKMGIPIVSTNHAIPENLMDNLRLLAPVSRPINYMLKTYYARFHAKADYVTLPTQSAIAMLDLDGKNKLAVPVEPVSNGIDLARFHPGPRDEKLLKRFDLPLDVPIVAYIGRLDVEKHIPVLMRAFKQVHDEVPKTHLLIVGDGTEFYELNNLARKLGIVRHVTLTGRVNEEDLVALHKVGTVYCMPSPAELQSIATLEAMASGQPIIAVDAGALGELCQNERNGFLCDQDDEDAIAAGIKTVVTDPALRKKFSEESIAIANTHDIKTTYDRFEAIYTKLTS